MTDQVSADERGEFREPLRDRRDGTSLPGEEEIRFIRNFHDIFLSIGLAMFAVGLGIVSSLIAGNLVDVENINGVEAAKSAGRIFAGISFIDAAIMWGLAEIFARSRRLFLPAIVILLAFILFFTSGVFVSYVTLFAEQDFKEFDDAVKQLKALPLTVSLAGAAAIFIYYLRMKLPFAMGLFGVALAAAGVSLLGYLQPDVVVNNVLKLQLAAGVFLFFLGVFYDARDPERRTRLSDNGFWLHFFAAPLIFYSVTVMTTGVGGAVTGGATAAVTTLIVVGVFALISLLINRRALLVSGLISAAIAIGVLVSQTGLDGAWTAALTLLLLGGAMVLLGGGWHTVRRLLVAPFPNSGPIARIIPPETGNKE